MHSDEKLLTIALVVARALLHLRNCSGLMLYNYGACGLTLFRLLN